MNKPAYTYPNAFYVLTPLLNADTQSATRQMIYQAYDTYADLISLSIQEQRGLIFIGAFTAQDAIDSIDESLVWIVHASQDRCVFRAIDRANKCTKSPTAPQKVSSAVRLFKSFRKSNSTIRKSATPNFSPEECTRQKYQRLWSYEEAPAKLRAPEAVEPVKLHDRDTMCNRIREYSSSKSAGGIGLHAVIMKNLLGSTFADHLSALYDLISEYGCTPTSWNTAITTLLSKRDDGSSCLSTEVRPISLQVMFRTISGKLMLAESEEKIPLHTCQFGFKRGYDTQSNILCVEAAKEQGAFNRIITDHMEAYDSPRWSLLVQKLQRYALAPMLLRITVILIFREMYSVFIVNGTQLKKIRLNRGLFQGSLLSPVLFNIFIDDLLQGTHQRFATAGNTFPAVMLADDLLLLWRTGSEALSM